MRICFKLAAVCCVFCMTGCQQDDEIMNPGEELVMSVEASIENAEGSRYASVKESGIPDVLKFVSGDNIGIFVDDRDVTKWTKSETGSWDTAPNPVYWPDKSSTLHHFYAFYPFPTETTTFSKKSVPMPSLSGQNGTIESLSACDFMVATVNQSYGSDGVVSFTGETNCFKHVSSLVAITILKESDLKESVINKISFEGANTDLGALTSYSFETETVSVDTANDKVESAGLNVSMANETTNKTLYFILNSGINLSSVTFSIGYSTDGKNYTATKTGLGDGSFASGSRYNFNLNIIDGVLSITGADIQDWGTGTDMEDIIINTPVEDQNDEND